MSKGGNEHCKRHSREDDSRTSDSSNTVISDFEGAPPSSQIAHIIRMARKRSSGIRDSKVKGNFFSSLRKGGNGTVRHSSDIPGARVSSCRTMSESNKEKRNGLSKFFRRSKRWFFSEVMNLRVQRASEISKKDLYSFTKDMERLASYHPELKDSGLKAILMDPSVNWLEEEAYKFSTRNFQFVNPLVEREFVRWEGKRLIAKAIIVLIVIFLIIAVSAFAWTKVFVLEILAWIAMWVLGISIVLLFMSLVFVGDALLYSVELLVLKARFDEIIIATAFGVSMIPMTICLYLTTKTCLLTPKKNIISHLPLTPKQTLLFCDHVVNFLCSFIFAVVVMIQKPRVFICIPLYVIGVACSIGGYWLYPIEINLMLEKLCTVIFFACLGLWFRYHDEMVERAEFRIYAINNVKQTRLHELRMQLPARLNALVSPLVLERLIATNGISTLNVLWEFRSRRGANSIDEIDAVKALRASINNIYNSRNVDFNRYCTVGLLLLQPCLNYESDHVKDYINAFEAFTEVTSKSEFGGFELDGQTPTPKNEQAICLSPCCDTDCKTNTSMRRDRDPRKKINSYMEGWLRIRQLIEYMCDIYGVERIAVFGNYICVASNLLVPNTYEHANRVVRFAFAASKELRLRAETMYYSKGITERLDRTSMVGDLVSDQDSGNVSPDIRHAGENLSGTQQTSMAFTEHAADLSLNGEISFQSLIASCAIHSGRACGAPVGGEGGVHYALFGDAYSGACAAIQHAAMGSVIATESTVRIVSPAVTVIDTGKLITFSVLNCSAEREGVHDTAIGSNSDENPFTFCNLPDEDQELCKLIFSKRPSSNERDQLKSLYMQDSGNSNTGYLTSFTETPQNVIFPFKEPPALGSITSQGTSCNRDKSIVFSRTMQTSSLLAPEILETEKSTSNSRWEDLPSCLADSKVVSMKTFIVIDVKEVFHRHLPSMNSQKSSAKIEETETENSKNTGVLHKLNPSTVEEATYGITKETDDLFQLAKNATAKYIQKTRLRSIRRAAQASMRSMIMENRRAASVLSSEKSPTNCKTLTPAARQTAPTPPPDLAVRHEQSISMFLNSASNAGSESYSSGVLQSSSLDTLGSEHSGGSENGYRGTHTGMGYCVILKEKKAPKWQKHYEDTAGLAMISSSEDDSMAVNFSSSSQNTVAETHDEKETVPEPTQPDILTTQQTSEFKGDVKIQQTPQPPNSFSSSDSQSDADGIFEFEGASAQNKAGAPGRAYDERDPNDRFSEVVALLPSHFIFYFIEEFDDKMVEDQFQRLQRLVRGPKMCEFCIAAAIYFCLCAFWFYYIYYPKITDIVIFTCAILCSLTAIGFMQISIRKYNCKMNWCTYAAIVFFMITIFLFTSIFNLVRSSAWHSMFVLYAWTLMMTSCMPWNVKTNILFQAVSFLSFVLFKYYTPHAMLHIRILLHMLILWVQMVMLTTLEDWNMRNKFRSKVTANAAIAMIRADRDTRQVILEASVPPPLRSKFQGMKKLTIVEMQQTRKLTEQVSPWKMFAVPRSVRQNFITGSAIRDSPDAEHGICPGAIVIYIRFDGIVEESVRLNRLLDNNSTVLHPDTETSVPSHSAPSGASSGNIFEGKRRGQEIPMLLTAYMLNQLEDVLDRVTCMYLALTAGEFNPSMMFDDNDHSDFILPKNVLLERRSAVRKAPLSLCEVFGDMAIVIGHLGNYYPALKSVVPQLQKGASVCTESPCLAATVRSAEMSSRRFDSENSNVQTPSGSTNREGSLYGSIHNTNVSDSNYVCGITSLCALKLMYGLTRATKNIVAAPDLSGDRIIRLESNVNLPFKEIGKNKERSLLRYSFAASHGPVSVVFLKSEGACFFNSLSKYVANALLRSIPNYSGAEQNSVAAAQVKYVEGEKSAKSGSGRIARTWGSRRDHKQPSSQLNMGETQRQKLIEPSELGRQVKLLMNPVKPLMFDSVQRPLAPGVVLCTTQILHSGLRAIDYYMRKTELSCQFLRSTIRLLDRLKDRLPTPGSPKAEKNRDIFEQNFGEIETGEEMKRVNMEGGSASPEKSRLGGNLLMEQSAASYFRTICEDKQNMLTTHLSIEIPEDDNEENVKATGKESLEEWEGAEKALKHCSTAMERLDNMKRSIIVGSERSVKVLIPIKAYSEHDIVEHYDYVRAYSLNFADASSTK